MPSWWKMVKTLQILGSGFFFVDLTPTEGTKKKYADLLAYINYNTYLCNIKLKQHDRYIWR